MFDSKHELLELSSQGYILLPQSLALQVHTVSKGKQRKCKRLLKPLIQVNWLYTFTVEVLIKYRSDNNQQHVVCPVCLAVMLISLSMWPLIWPGLSMCSISQIQATDSHWIWGLQVKLRVVISLENSWPLSVATAVALCGMTTLHMEMNIKRVSTYGMEWFLSLPELLNSK